jgi:hypothetical protein
MKKDVVFDPRSQYKKPPGGGFSSGEPDRNILDKTNELVGGNCLPQKKGGKHSQPLNLESQDSGLGHGLF